ncbi:MAG: response regulator [Terriglobales bacterium]
MKNRLRILVVDDQHSVLLTYRLVLQQQGHDVTAAPTCECAVEHLQQSDFDLLVCDFGLNGGRTGFDVIDFARAQNPHIASVLLTGYNDPEITQEAHERGVTVLNKPVEVPALLAALRCATRTAGAA